jgi:uncharacterized membrane protein
MANVRESIEVDAPVASVYETWTRFEDFPRFMEHVREVRRIGDRETEWTTHAMGVTQRWRARTTEERSPERLAWQAEGDTGMDGVVEFEPIGLDRTRIRVDFDWRGGGLKEGVAHALHIDSASVRKDLENFKRFVEQRAATTPAL